MKSYKLRYILGRMCKTLPLELKTGRPSGSAEHRGQLILYSMMMSERRPDPEAGLLLYLRTSSMQEIKAGIHEMRGLVQLRNHLAFHLANDNEVHIHIFNFPYYTQRFLRMNSFSSQIFHFSAVVLDYTVVKSLYVEILLYLIYICDKKKIHSQKNVYFFNAVIILNFC